MKSILSLACALVLCLGAFSCSSKSDNGDVATEVKCCCTEDGGTCEGNCGCECEGCKI